MATYALSKFNYSGTLPIVINIDRITSIKEESVNDQNVVVIHLAEDSIVTDMTTLLLCAQTILSGAFTA